MNGKTLLTDSGFWIALLDKGSNVEQNPVDVSILEMVEKNNYTVLVPWPTLYEFVNTRLARRGHQLVELENFLQKPNVQLLDETSYREQSLARTFEQTRFGYLTHSLVDCVIREILGDPKTRVDFFATFNPGDFLDVCQSRKIEVLN